MNAQAAAEARRWLGTPYRHQGAARGAGCDCLGLIRGIWRTLYGREAAQVPPYSPDWRDPDTAGGLEGAARRYLIAHTGTLSAGHVVLFRLARRLPVRHCGVMVTDTRFIHAQEQVGVIEAELDGRWRGRLAGVFAFPENRKDISWRQ